MTTGTGDTISPRLASEAGADWEAIRARTDIQFAPIDYPGKAPPEAPAWLRAIAEFLYNVFSGLADLIGVSWPVFKWLIVGAAIVFLGLLLWRMLAPVLRRSRPAIADPEEESGWAPDREDARSLLEEADCLAASGQFAEAVHLLLRRSIEQIATARPRWLEPSSTAREIAGIPALPEGARSAFTVIAERVERSLFALRNLDAGDWQAARSAYADFALESFGNDVPLEAAP